ncbi:MAG TPA: isoprenyl transferase [Acidobacteriota bacterium]
MLAVVEPGSLDEELVRALDFDRLPAHVAIIMDGNGRWARRRGLTRVAGHRAGIDSVREAVETAARLGLKILTLYAFSRENWKRPESEVSTLMDLLKEYLRRELKTLKDNNIRFEVIGRMAELPESVVEELKFGIDRTASCTGLLFNIALNYGGRTEIVDAVNRWLESGGPQAGPLTEAAIAERLYTGGQPDPDLLIRTSGEMRVSNFLLWQIAYSEIWVTQTLWPDFRRRHLLEALLDFQKRERRYGAVT